MIKKGNNPYNNRVIIDYDHKSIKFMPIGKKDQKKYFFLFWFNLAVVMFALNLIPYLLGMILQYKNIYPLNWVFYYLFAISLPVIVSYALAKKWFYNETWRREYYPELNYKLLKLMHFGIIKKVKLESSNIHDKTFIIPFFSNVMLKYKATGDFKKIQKIIISNLFIANPFKWFCLIKFKEIPKKGFMEIEYL